MSAPRLVEIFAQELGEAFERLLQLLLDLESPSLEAGARCRASDVG